MTVTSNIFPDGTASGGNKLQPWAAGQAYPSTQGVARASTATYFNQAGTFKTAATNELRVTGSGNLLENASTNYIRNPAFSGASAPSTLPTNWAATAPAGVTSTLALNTESGMPCMDVTFTTSGTTLSAGGTTWARPEANNGIAPSGITLPSSVWSHSLYLKLQAGSLANVAMTFGIDEYNATTYVTSEYGTITPTGAALTSQRFTRVSTMSASTVTLMYPSVTINFNTTGPINFTLRFGLWQLEPGSTVTSAIIPSGSLPGLGLGNYRAQDLALIPRRVSTAANSAYELVTPGTSLGSGTGPSGTGAAITDGSCVWKYLSSIDYTNLQSWVNSIPSTLADNYVGRIWNTGPISSGDHWIDNESATRTPGSFTMTLTAAPGDSFCDSLVNQTTPLAFNVNNGVSLTCSVPSIPVDFLAWLDNNVIIEGLQFQDTHSNDSSTIASIGANSAYRNCLFDGYTQGGGANMIQLCGGTIANCILIDRNSGVVGASGVNAWDVTIDPGSNTNHIVNCTFVAVTPNTSVQAISHNSTVAPIYRNCMFLGYQTSPFGLLGGVYASPLVDHCLLSNASMPANGTDSGSNLFSRTAANQFVVAYTDFRLKSGADAINRGVNDTADIPTSTDITRTTVRPTGLWDIGPWEYFLPNTCAGSGLITVRGSGTATLPAPPIVPLVGARSTIDPSFLPVFLVETGKRFGVTGLATVVESISGQGCTATATIFKLGGRANVAQAGSARGIASIPPLVAVVSAGQSNLGPTALGTDPVGGAISLALDPPLMSFSSFTSPAETAGSVSLSWTLVLTPSIVLYIDNTPSYTAAAVASIVLQGRGTATEPLSVTAAPTLFSLQSSAQVTQSNPASSTNTQSVAAMALVLGGTSAVARNNLDFTGYALFPYGSLYAETAFGGVLNLSSPSQDSYDVVLQWNPPNRILSFVIPTASGIAGQGNVAHSSLQFLGVLRSVAAIAQNNQLSATNALLGITGTGNALQQLTASSTQTIESLVAAATAKVANAGVGVGRIDYVGRGTGSVAGAVGFVSVAFTAAGVVTPVPKAAAAVNIDVTAVVRLSLFTQATSTNSQTFSGQVVAQQSDTADTTGVLTFAGNGVIVAAGLCQAHVAILSLQAVVLVTAQNPITTVGSVFGLSVYHILPQILTAEDGSVLVADDVSVSVLLADLPFFNVIEVSGFTGIGDLLTPNAIGTAQVGSLASGAANIDLSAVNTVDQRNNVVGQGIITFTNTGALNGSFVGLGSLSFSVYRSPSQILLSDSDNLQVSVDPPSLNLILKADVAPLNVIQEDSWSATQDISFSASATLNVWTIVEPITQSIDLQSAGQVDQYDHASSSERLDFVGSGAASFLGTIVASATFFPLSVAATLSSSTNVAASGNQDVTGAASLTSFTNVAVAVQQDLTGSGTALLNFSVSHGVGQQDLSGSGTLTMAGLVQARLNQNYVAAASLSSNTNASGEAALSLAGTGTTTLFATTSVVGQQDFTGTSTVGFFNFVQATANQDLSASATATITYFVFANGVANQDFSAVATAVSANQVRGVGSANAINYWLEGTATYTALVENQAQAVGSSNAIELSAVGTAAYTTTVENQAHTVDSANAINLWGTGTADQTVTIENHARGVGSANAINFFVTGVVLPYAPFIGQATFLSLEAEAVFFQPVVAGTGTISFAAVSSLGQAISIDGVGTIVSDATGAVAQSAPVTGSGEIDVAAAAEAASSTRVAGVANLFLSAAATAEINGSVVTGTVPIEIVFVSARLGQAALAVTGEPAPMFMAMESVSGRLWVTPPYYVEGEQIIWWSD